MTIRSATRHPTDVPAGYRFLSTVDLSADPKASGAIRLVFGAVVVAMIGAAFLLDLPLTGFTSTGTTILVTAVACLGYMAAHEWTHGVLLRMLSGQPSTYAFRFPYLTTGSEALLDRRSFVVVALGPAVVWGVIVGILLLVLPAALSLSAYVVLSVNLAGSAGDYVQALSVSRLPDDALIRDDGRQTSVFVPAS